MVLRYVFLRGFPYQHYVANTRYSSVYTTLIRRTSGQKLGTFNLSDTFSDTGEHWTEKIVTLRDIGLLPRCRWGLHFSEKFHRACVRASLPTFRNHRLFMLWSFKKTDVDKLIRAFSFKLQNSTFSEKCFGQLGDCQLLIASFPSFPVNWHFHLIEQVLKL